MTGSAVATIVSPTMPRNIGKAIAGAIVRNLAFGCGIGGGSGRQGTVQ
jgi:hypothetical protein